MFSLPFGQWKVIKVVHLKLLYYLLISYHKAILTCNSQNFSHFTVKGLKNSTVNISQSPILSSAHLNGHLEFCMSSEITPNTSSEAFKEAGYKFKAFSRPPGHHEESFIRLLGSPEVLHLSYRYFGRYPMVTRSFRQLESFISDIKIFSEFYRYKWKPSIFFGLF